MLHAAVYCLYIIYCLYRSEFFCFSLAAVFADFSFYFYSKGLGMNARTAIIAIVTALVLAAVALLANRAAKSKGSVKLFGKTVKVFPAKFNATVLYVACTVLGCCLVACLVLARRCLPTTACSRPSPSSSSVRCITRSSSNNAACSNFTFLSIRWTGR